MDGYLSYRKISWCLEAARLGLKIFQLLWGLTGTSAAGQISERFGHYNIQSCSFETSRDLAVRRLFRSVNPDVRWWHDYTMARKFLWRNPVPLCASCDHVWYSNGMRARFFIALYVSGVIKVQNVTRTYDDGVQCFNETKRHKPVRLLTVKYSFRSCFAFSQRTASHDVYEIEPGIVKQCCW